MKKIAITLLALAAIACNASALKIASGGRLLIGPVTLDGTPKLALLKEEQASPPVGGYVAWYDVSDTTSVTANASGTVTAWRDKSGNDYHVDINGKEATYHSGEKISFASAGAFLLPTELRPVGDTPFTVFLVMSHDAAYAAAVQVFNTSTGATIDTAGSCVMQVATNSVSIHFFENAFYHAGRLLFNNTDTVVFAEFAGDGRGPGFENYYQLLTYGFRASEFGTAAKNTQELGDFSFCTYSGHIREAIFYHSILSDDDRQTMIDYLNGKWPTLE